MGCEPFVTLEVPLTAWSGSDLRRAAAMLMEVAARLDRRT